MANLIDKIVIANAPIDPAASEFLISISPHYPTIAITALIGIGSIFTSAAVVYITRKNQESQNRAKLSELRYEWLKEFRETASEFIGVCTHIKSCFNNNSFEKGQFDFLQMQAYSLRSRLILMLDTDTEVKLIIESLTQDLIVSAIDTDVNDKDYLSYLDQNREQFIEVANQFWSQVQVELN
ncbi:hypothetical protein JKP11_20750 [Vibrio vulnificus]|uniref:hypothetical protein n=1 Tax=Vibrio vulnificus TaxID=672 RepID=UPI00102A200D|nr:hypothetical protein [Vibrio vulnificus]EID0694582.1 hypothetical protein [Vibrio vulnificus]MCA3958082.1 hypothetical protein [Vibrio vulnificus]RZR32212.1 hypothetical protein D8T59_22900 [Vibrio vulnificus]